MMMIFDMFVGFFFSMKSINESCLNFKVDLKWQKSRKSSKKWQSDTLIISKQQISRYKSGSMSYNYALDSNTNITYTPPISEFG